MRIWIWQGLAVAMFTAMAVCHAWKFGGGDLAAGMKHWRGLYVLYVFAAFGVAEVLMRRRHR
jgi:hypothetical protein